MPCTRMHHPCLRRDEGAVAILTLNRPASRNSLSTGMLAALQAALDEVAADRGIRAVVLAAEGPAFSAGHDLKEVTAHRADADGGAAFFAGIMAACGDGDAGGGRAAAAGRRRGAGHRHRRRLPARGELRPGGGLRRRPSSARPGVDIGLFCSTPGVALARAVPRKSAMEMLLLGEMIPAGEAQRMGLVNRVVPPEAVLPTALALAQQIASRSAVAVQLGKRGFNAQQAMPLRRSLCRGRGGDGREPAGRGCRRGDRRLRGQAPPGWRHR